MTLKLHPLSAAVILTSLSLASTVYADRTTSGSLVTYTGDALTASLVEDADPANIPQLSNLILTGVSVTLTAPNALQYPAAVSFGGVNGAIGVEPRDYGAISLYADQDTTINVDVNGRMSGIYVRTDTDGTSLAESAATINIISTSTASVAGILSENLRGVSDTSRAVVNAKTGSNITIQGNGEVSGIAANSTNARVTTDKGSSVTINGTVDSTNLRGIRAVGLAGTDSQVRIDNYGDITINGIDSVNAAKFGITILDDVGTSRVLHVGNINITGTNSTGIHNTSSTGIITTLSGSSIILDGGDNNKGIYSTTTGGIGTNSSIMAAGDILIGNTVNAGDGNTGVQGIQLDNTGTDNATITYNDADGTIQIDRGSTSNTDISAGIIQNSTAGVETLIDVRAIKQIIMNGQNSAALASFASGGAGDSTINLANGSLHTLGNNADGIYAKNANNDATINITANNSVIVAQGDGSAGAASTEAIIADKDGSTGSVNINVSGTSIDVNSNAGTGISVTGISDGSSNVTLNNMALHVNSLGDSSANSLMGISAQGIGAGNTATVNITKSVVQVAGEGDVTAIDATATTGADVVVNTLANTPVTASSSAGVATGINAVASDAGVVTVNTNGNVGAYGDDSTGIIATTDTGENNVTVGGNKATLIHGGGGSGAGINMTSTSGNQNLNIMGGIVEADSDLAITSNNGSGITTANNNGTVIGYNQFVGDDVTFTNQGSGKLLLQDFSSGSKGSITSSFGTNGTFNNQGLVALSNKNADGTVTDATLSDLATFNNQGMIDLTMGSNAIAGSTLTITNGGNGNFVSNGGSLHLNTNVSTASTTSDQLILDNATTGAGATQIYVTPTPHSVYGILSGDGIQLVKVNGTSTTDAFALGRPVMNGIYEYGLFQGDLAGTQDSWYLRNIITSDNAYNPVLGGYLANQSAATQMFGQQLRDRLLASTPAVSKDTAERNDLWLRTQVTRNRYDLIDEGLHNKGRTYTMQLGGDIGVWQLNEGYLHVGVMGGYGDYKNITTSQITHTKADSTVKGYNAGVYGTWFQNTDSALGLYVDTWSQFGWFNNKTSGKDVDGSKKYRSQVWSNSVEAGYGLLLTKNSPIQWIATPQAQLTYNHYAANNLYDRHNELTVKNSKASGLVSRVGARLQGRDVSRKQPIEPFVEMNWINNTAKNKLTFNGTDLKDGQPRNRFEAKVGVQGNVTDKFNVSAQVGGQWGKNQFHQYQGQLNLNYRF